MCCSCQAATQGSLRLIAMCPTALATCLAAGLSEQEEAGLHGMPTLSHSMVRRCLSRSMPDRGPSCLGSSWWNLQRGTQGEATCGAHRRAWALLELCRRGGLNQYREAAWACASPAGNLCVG